MERDSPGAGGEMLEAIPSSELYEKHMQVRTFDERLDVKADIRRVNESVGDLKGQYKIVDRLGEGKSSDQTLECYRVLEWDDGGESLCG